MSSDKLALEAAFVWIEEAVEYVNDETCSPSLEREGRDLLRRLSPAIKAAREAEKQAGPVAGQAPAPAPELLDCEIAPRPLSYSLRDYHRAGLDGPLHAQWQDKPHRLLYDLIAAVRHYAGTQCAAVAHAAPPSPLAEQDKEDAELTDEQLAVIERIEYKFGRFDDGEPKDWQEWVDFREVIGQLRAARAKKEPQ